MNPENLAQPLAPSTPVPDPTPTPPVKNQGARRNSVLTVLSLFLIIMVGVVIFLAYQNYGLQKQVALLQATPSPIPMTTLSPVISPTPSATASGLPVLASPQSGATVSSPLLITGVAPQSWIYGGTFPVTIVDSKSNLVAQGDAKEVTAGSWKTQNPVKFSVTLPFSTTDSSGFLVLTANSSGSAILTGNSIQIPLNF